MSKVVMISVASSVALGLLSVHLVKQLKEGEATIADLQTQVATLQEQQKQREPVPPPREISPPAEVIAPQPSEVIGTPPKQPPKTIGVVEFGRAAPAGPPNVEDRMRALRDHRERQRQLMQDPEYRDAMRVQARGNFARQYPGVIQELGLSSQQADEFFDLLADQQMRANEQMQPLWEMASSDPADQAAIQERQNKISQQITESQRKNEAELAARFGQDKLQAWKEYQSTMGMRYELENMRNALASSGVPLSEDLSKPMLKALAQAQQVEMNELTASNRAAGPFAARLMAGNNFDPGTMERHLEATKKRNQRMLDAISPYLSYEQREAIQKQQEAQVKMQEAQYRLMRAQGKAEPGADGVYFIEGSSALVPLRP